jgi:hypothetical protein
MALDWIEFLIVFRRYGIDVMGLVFFFYGYQLLKKPVETIEASKMDATIGEHVKISLSTRAVGAILCVCSTVIFCVSLFNPPSIHRIPRGEPQEANQTTGASDVVQKNSR